MLVYKGGANNTTQPPRVARKRPRDDGALPRVLNHRAAIGDCYIVVACSMASHATVVGWPGPSQADAHIASVVIII